MTFFLIAFTILILVIYLLYLARVVFLFIGSFWAGPYVPLAPEIVREVINIADIKPGEKLVDLGSGDGRVLMAAAEKGAKATGYEIDPFLVCWSRRKIRKNGLQNKAKVLWKNLRKADLSDVDAVTIYLFPKIMALLEEKCQKELPFGARVVSVRFPFPKWTPEAIAQGKIYLYQK